MYVKKILMLWVAVLALALPLLLIMTGNARAVGITPAAGTYNTDAAVQDATSGQWDLPSNFFCVEPAQSPLGTEWNPAAITISNAGTYCAGLSDPGAVNRSVSLYSGDTDSITTNNPGYVNIAGTCSKPTGTYPNNAYGCASATGSWTSSFCVKATTNAKNAIKACYSPSGTLGMCNTSASGKMTVASACTGTYVWTPIVTANADNTAAVAACAAKGYLWSGYSNACGASGLTTTDPDNRALGYYDDHKGCLRCHNTSYIGTGGHGADTWAMKDSYLKGGHKNMVRKVTPGLPWGLPGTDASGIYNIGVDWATGMTGTYTAYWIYGGNGLEGVAPSVISSKGGSYSCGRCHATGWTSDSTINTNKEPGASFPGINIGTGAGQVNLKGGITGDANIYSSWDRFGIQCSRCHNAQG